MSEVEPEQWQVELQEKADKIAQLGFVGEDPDATLAGLQESEAAAEATPEAAPAESGA